DAQIRYLRLDAERVRNDRAQALQLRRLDRRNAHLAVADVGGALQRRQHDREIDRDLRILNGERRREVERLVARFVDDETALQDLLRGERARLDLRDEQLVDDGDACALGIAAQQDLIVADQTNVVQRVDTGDGERRNVERRVRLNGQLQRCRQRRAAQRRLDD